MNIWLAIALGIVIWLSIPISGFIRWRDERRMWREWYSQLPLPMRDELIRAWRQSGRFRDH
jgi:hypothetical protein